MKKKVCIATIALLFLGVLPSLAQSLQRHSPVPAIELVQPSGEKFNLSCLKGKYVLIDFWASWCGPCRQESGHLRKAYNTYKNQNFTIVSVSVDKPRDREKWLDAIKADGLVWTQLLDDKKTSDSYGVESLPSAFLIDPEGNLLSQGETLRGQDLMKTLAKYIKN